MRALRFHGNKDIRIDDVPEPELRAGWVKIKNAWCGICGSDLHEFSVGPMNTTATPHALTGESLPAICDGTCYWCRTENYRLCDKWGFLGYSGYGGGMAEYVCVDRKACHKIPEHLGLDVAALVEPLAVGWHAVKESRVGPEDHCLVLGAGPIGISVVHCLVARGVTSIIVSEPSSLRLTQAKAAGATHIVNPVEEDVTSYCRRVSEGLGAHVVFECAGLPVTFNTAMQSVRGRGTIVNVAIYESELTLKMPNLLSRHQITVFGSNTYTRRDFDEVIEALATGRMRAPENMITARVPLSRAIEDGFLELLSSKDKHVKILVIPEL